MSQTYDQSPTPLGVGASSVVGAVAAPTKVFRVPLAPGEKVVRYDEYSYVVDQVLLTILGLFTMCLGVGFYFLYKALTRASNNPAGLAVTTQRIIVGANRNFLRGQPIIIPLAQVADVVPVRPKGSALDVVDDGFVGAVINAGATAIENQLCDKFDKTTKVYWRGAEDVLVITTDGMRTKLHSTVPSDDGRFLSEGFAQGGFEKFAEVLVEARG